MNFLLSVIISSLLIGLFVTIIEASDGSGSDESGSGSNENHRRHSHNKNRPTPDSQSYQHFNHPAYVPQLSPYPGYYGIPPYPYSGYHGPMHPQIPFYGLPQLQYQQVQVPAATYANNGYYYPGVTAAAPVAPVYPGLASFQYSGQVAPLPPQAPQASLGQSQYSNTQHVGLPLAQQPEVAQAAIGFDQNLRQAHTEGRQLPNIIGDGANGGDAGTGVSSSSLNHHLKVNQEYAEDGHKHSVNRY